MLFSECKNGTKTWIDTNTESGKIVVTYIRFLRGKSYKLSKTIDNDVHTYLRITTNVTTMDDDDFKLFATATSYASIITELPSFK